LGGGGHSAQAMLLVKRLGDRYAYEFVAATSNRHAKRVHHRILNPRTMSDRNPFWIAMKGGIAGIQSLGVLFRTKASTIVACGPAIAVPLCILGKLSGKKVIYLESWARVKTVSRSGKLTYPFADLFLVQSKELLRQLPRAQYAGRLA
jgi:beta-1,4-N-acetylglucosaminyltransferase